MVDDAAFIRDENRNSDSNNCGTRQITKRNIVPENGNREEYNLLGTIHEPYHLCLRNQNVTLLNATSRGAKLSLKNNHERRANFGTKENPNMSVKWKWENANEKKKTKTKMYRYIDIRIGKGGFRKKRRHYQKAPEDVDWKWETGRAGQRTTFNK